jgi:hypothetical protein
MRRRNGSNSADGLEDPRLARVPIALRPHAFRPSTSGNPGGFPKSAAEAKRLAAEASPLAMARLVAMINSTDERVAIAACVEVLNRALGRPGVAAETEAEMLRTALDRIRSALTMRIGTVPPAVHEVLDDLAEDGGLRQRQEEAADIRERVLRLLRTGRPDGDEGNGQDGE